MIIFYGSNIVVFGILLTLFIIHIINQYPTHTAYAHNFSITEDASLVTLIEEIKAETQLVNTNFVSNNNISTIEHARNAANLITDLNGKLRQNTEEDIIQVYDNGLYNSTTLALVVANLVDEILRKYGSAYNIKYDLTNMSNIIMTRMSNIGNSSSSLNMTASATGSAHLEHSDVLKKNNFMLVNIYDYQTAQIPSDVVNRLFNDKLAVQSPANETVTIGKLVSSLKQLKHAVGNKAPAEALMEIANIQIQPMLQKAYDLKFVV